LEMLAAVGHITVVLASFLVPFLGMFAVDAVHEMVTAEDDHNERPPKNLCASIQGTEKNKRGDGYG